VESLLIACDFDGTITQRDSLHLIVEEFGTPGVWAEIEPRLRAGELTLEGAMERQFAAVRATPEEVRELVLREAPLRPGFPEFVDWARRSGHRLVVLSSGFRTVIDAVLGTAGLGDLHVHSHDARFSRAGCRLLWSDRGTPCAECGRPCKRHDLAGARRPGRDGRLERLVYLGDGISDRCAALSADVVFARDGLAEYLAAREVPFAPLEDFFAVRARLEAPAAHAA
jgi:2-hydroxy-3-keto-5-methylthiopentenyl-1-phosphate phosphatase